MKKDFFENEKMLFLKMKNLFFWKCGNVIIEKFYQRIFEILKGILTFQKTYFSIFSAEKKKLRKFSNHYIDVKFPEESIFRIFRAV